MSSNNKNYPEPHGIDKTNVVSSTECTGLVTGLPDNEYQMDAYTEICHIPEQGSLGKLEDELEKEMQEEENE